MNMGEWVVEEKSEPERTNGTRLPGPMNQVGRALLIVCGTLSVALGLLGIFVPVLPTTPFLLLAAFCYARSSQRFHQWLLGNHWFGRYIENYQQGRGLPLRDKFITITALWLTLSFTLVTADLAWWAKLLLGLVGTGVTVHVLRIKTLRPEAGASRKTSAPSPGEPEHES